MRINGTEIWTEYLKAISAAGTATLRHDELYALYEFATATPAGDADIIAQYSVDDMGFIDTNVFQGGGDRWTEFDPEDGPDNDHRADWKDLAVIMARDRMTNMVALRSSDAVPATVEELQAAAHGSLAAAVGLSGWPRLMYRSHDEWVDLAYGVGFAYTSEQLLNVFGNVGLVWTAPRSE
jgi:hypothetical protein